MITNKPHSSEDVLVQETDAFGQKVFRFTDAWYNYFNSVDTEFNVTVTQNITNISSSGAQSYASGITWEVDDLYRKLSSVSGAMHEPSGDLWGLTKRVRMLESRLLANDAGEIYALSERIKRLEARDSVSIGHQHYEIEELRNRLRQTESLVASLMGAAMPLHGLI